MINNTYTPISFQSRYPARVCQRLVAPSVMQQSSRVTETARDVVGVLRRNIPRDKGIMGVIGGVVALTAKAFNKISKIKITPISEKETGELQNRFSKLFLRTDITTDETKDIVRRYQAIEKIEDKTDYIKAMYKEAKHNFGLDHVDIDFVIKEGKKSDKGETMGSLNCLLKELTISPNNNRKIIANRVHHELRHLKQYSIAANYDKESLARTIFNRFIREDSMEKMSEEEMRPYLDNIISQLERRLGPLFPESIPKSLNRYAKRCIDSLSKYVNLHENTIEYRNNFIELDAMCAGREIDDIRARVRTRRFSKN